MTAANSVSDATISINVTGKYFMVEYPKLNRGGRYRNRLKCTKMSTRDALFGSSGKLQNGRLRNGPVQ